MGDARRRYLERVEISNFRAYGESFVLTLPAEPGITLIYGPNGLGKTTFFDALEWGLTGGIRRFEGYIKAAKRTDHLTRFGAPKDSHRVSLYFTESAPIDRGVGFHPEPDSVVVLLKEADWPEVSDVGVYLSLTHFLGQSSAQRFSVKKPKEQWEAIRGLAGVDRVNYLRERLGGQAARQAFNREVAQAEFETKRRRLQLADARALVEHLERATALARARDALTPGDVADRCNRLSALLVQRGVIPNTPTNRGTNPESLLEDVTRSVRDAAEFVRGAAGLSEAMDQLTREFQETQLSLSLCEQEIADLSKQRDALNGELSVASTALNDARVAQSQAKESLASAERTIATYDRLIRLDGDIQLALEREKDIEVELVAIAKRLREVDEEHSSSLEQYNAVANLVEIRDAAADRLMSLGAAYSLAVECEQQRRSIVSRRPGSDIKVLLTELIDRRETLATRRSSLEEDINGLRADLSALDRRNETLASLVGEIAALVRADDERCPLCETSFSRGELFARVQKTAARPADSPAVPSELGERLGAALTELSSTSSELDIVAREVARLDVFREESESLSRRESALLEQMGRLGLEAQPDARTAIQAAIAASEDEVNRTRLAAIDEQRTRLHQRLATLVNERHELAARGAIRGAELSSLRDSREASLQAIRSALGDSSATIDAKAQWLADRRRAEAETREAETRVNETGLDARRLETAEEDLNVRVRELSRNLDQRIRSRDDFVARLDLLRDRWKAEKLPDDPNAAGAWDLRDRAQRLDRVVSESEEDLAEITRGYEAWVSDEERSRLEEALTKMLADSNVTSVADLDTKLAKSVYESEHAEARLRATREAAFRLSNDLKDQADRYAQSVFEPLSSTIQSYSRALMSEPDDSLFYRAHFRANRSEFKPGIVQRMASGEIFNRDMDPNLFFSEGQLSALSVSFLLAASTTFQWSRWPALLMDDPLQHNDIIHASAFIDLLRRLVQKRDYQAIISTHDSDEAEYIARKCETARIPFHRCELRPSGGRGLVSD